MSNNFASITFYRLKPYIPRRFQIVIRRALVSRQRVRYRDIWPIDERAAVPPEGWKGWPGDKKFAFVVTHDVDTTRGQAKCRELAAIDKRLGIRSSFNIVPERYPIIPEITEFLVDSGFEVGVHDLNHDGKLFSSRKVFCERSVRINNYLREWNAVGFRSGSMHKNLDWIHDLEIEYDSSTYDTDPFEPWSTRVGTTFPFLVTKDSYPGYIELPYTLPQDFTLFVLMQKKSIDVWKNKIDWIAEKGGMALLPTHPDYMSFHENSMNFDEFPSRFYEEFLEYVQSRYGGQYWAAQPREVARFWREEFLGMKTPAVHKSGTREEAV